MFETGKIAIEWLSQLINEISCEKWSYFDYEQKNKDHVMWFIKT